MDRYEITFEGDPRTAFFHVEGSGWSWVFVFDGQTPAPRPPGPQLALSASLDPAPFVFPTCAKPVPTEADAILDAVAWARTQGRVAVVYTAGVTEPAASAKAEPQRKRASGSRGA